MMEDTEAGITTAVTIKRMLAHMFNHIRLKTLKKFSFKILLKKIENINYMFLYINFIFIYIF
jgi:hypothetical protein